MSNVAKSPGMGSPPKSRARSPLYRFDGRIEPVRPSVLYLLGLAVTAFFMILLPLMYLGVIAGAGYLTYWHASNYHWIRGNFSGGTARASVWIFIVGYLFPLVAGLFTVLFLIKPLVARSSYREEEPVTLDRSQEPRLYSFLEQLCEAVGAPFPRRIDVSTIPNAAASFRRGFLSFFGRDFALHLGLSLAAGMTLKQFAGVIAHELGHFSQGGAMRFDFIIRRMNAWLWRIAYRRDQWDDQVSVMIESGGYLLLLGYFLKIVIWLVRRVLVLFFYMGHMISCSISRQMEYNADQFEARLIGSAEFAASTRRIMELSVGMSASIDRLQGDWRAKRLVDNIPMLVAHTSTHLPDGAGEWIEKELAEPRAGWFSTHPSPSQRIAAAERIAWPGVLHADGPAHALFSNFKMIANGVTLRYYRDVAELEVSAQNLIPVQQMAEAHQAGAEHQQALARYFQGCLSMSLALGLGRSIKPVTDAKALVAQLRAARTKFDTHVAKMRQLYETRKTAINRVAALRAASAVSRAKIKMNPKGWDLPAWSPEAVEAALSEARERLTKLDGKAAVAAQLFQARILPALGLGGVSAVRKRLGADVPAVDAVEKCLTALERVEAASGEVRRIDELGRCLGALFEHCTEEGPPASLPMLSPVINAIQEELRHTLEDVRATLDDAPFPFDHASEQMSCAEFLGPRLVPQMSPPDTLRMAGLVYGRVTELYARSLSVVAAYAEAVETAIGLPKLAKPENDDKQQ